MVYYSAHGEKKRSGENATIIIIDFKAVIQNINTLLFLKKSRICTVETFETLSASPDSHLNLCVNVSVNLNMHCLSDLE